MFSACYARLISMFSGLKLQAIICSKIDKDDCLKWGRKIADAGYFKDIISVPPIYRRLMEEPEFMVGELYCSTIKILTIGFISRLEFFLKDSMQLCMKRNYSLLKKGLYESKIAIEPSDVVEFDNIDEVRLKYINLISNKMTSGELWNVKFKKYINFLSLPRDLLREDINNKIDSVWKMRNDISHANNGGIITFDYDGNVYSFSSDIKVNEYVEFALIFIELVDECVTFFRNVDMLSLKKWEVKNGSLLHRMNV